MSLDGDIRSMSAYLNRRRRPLEEAARDVKASRERHKGLTIITSEDEIKLRRFERVTAGDE